MPLFGGFKKTFRLKSILKQNKENGNIGEPICGAYRINREEFFSSNDPTKRNTSPIVQMTYTQPTLKHAHSSDNALSNRQLPNTRQSMPDIAHPEPAPRKSKHEKEQRRIEKHEAERKKLELNEQKKREKLALKEREIQKLNKEQEKGQNKELRKQEKVEKKEVKKQEMVQNVKEQAKVQKKGVKEQEKVQKVKEQEKVQKKEVKEQEKVQKKQVKEQEKVQKVKEQEKFQKKEVKKASKVKSKKNAAPQPQVVNTVTAPANNIPQASNYSTNTLESSTSRTSGPPPYTEEPNIAPNRNDKTGNTSFSTPAEDFGSWDLISEHRQQLNRAKATLSVSKQTHMNLNYSMMDGRDNSEF